METLLLISKSKENLKLLADLAKKIGVSVKYLTNEEKEDIGLLNAIKTGRTGELIDTDKFLQNLIKPVN